jgi:hypothetical protein
MLLPQQLSNLPQFSHPPRCNFTSDRVAQSQRLNFTGFHPADPAAQGRQQLSNGTLIVSRPPDRGNESRHEFV